MKFTVQFLVVEWRRVIVIKITRQVNRYYSECGMRFQRSNERWKILSRKGASFFPRALGLVSDRCTSGIRTDAHLSLHEPHRQPSRNRLSRGMEAAAATTRRRQSVSLVAPRARASRGEERLRQGERRNRKSEMRRDEAHTTRRISSVVERDGCGKARGAAGYRGEEENTGCGTEGVVHIARRLCRGMEGGNIHNAPDTYTHTHMYTYSGRIHELRPALS